MKRMIQALKKNPLYAAAFIVAVAATVAAGTVFAADTVAKSGLIGVDSAKNFAYLDAGVNETEVVGVVADLDREGLTYVYEVDFMTEEAEYEYGVRAKDGIILEKEKKLASGKKKVDTDSGSKEERMTDNGTSQSYISLDDAKEIALKGAGIQNEDAAFTKAKLKREDGRAVYEIEFYANGYEYEFEIGAYDGDVVESSVEQNGESLKNSVQGSQSNSIRTENSEQEYDDAAGDMENPNGGANLNGVNNDYDDDDYDADDYYDDYDDDSNDDDYDDDKNDDD